MEWKNNRIIFYIILAVVAIGIVFGLNYLLMSRLSFETTFTIIWGVTTIITGLIVVGISKLPHRFKHIAGNNNYDEFKNNLSKLQEIKLPGSIFIKCAGLGIAAFEIAIVIICYRSGFLKEVASINLSLLYVFIPAVIAVIAGLFGLFAGDKVEHSYKFIKFSYLLLILTGTILIMDKISGFTLTEIYQYWILFILPVIYFIGSLLNFYIIDDRLKQINN